MDLEDLIKEISFVSKNIASSVRLGELVRTNYKIQGSLKVRALSAEDVEKIETFNIKYFKGKNISDQEVEDIIAVHMLYLYTS